MSDIKHILDSLHQYMFLNKTYSNRSFKDLPDTYFLSTNKNICEKKNIFVPEEKDKLFWCFYIMKYGMDKYKSIDQKHFKIETTFKINAAEDLVNHEILLKQNKLKKQEIENEFVNEKTITMKGLQALCILHKINIFFIFDKAFYIMNGLSDNKPFYIEKKDDVFGIPLDITDDKKNKVLQTFYEIEDYRKPIKCISAYKVDEIKNIAKIFNIILADTIGHKKTKKQLYLEIVSKIHI